MKKNEICTCEIFNGEWQQYYNAYIIALEKICAVFICVFYK